jgi:hypothetical protein
VAIVGLAVLENRLCDWNSDCKALIPGPPQEKLAAAV